LRYELSSTKNAASLSATEMGVSREESSASSRCGKRYTIQRAMSLSPE